MPAIDIRTYPRTGFDELQITGNSASTTLNAKICQAQVGLIPTAAGTTVANMLAPFAGTLVAARFVATDALTTHDTNFLTWGVINKGTGAGSTAMLAATAANTTKITGGSALVAFTPRTLTLSATAGNLVVAANDCLTATFIGGGTLANTISGGYIQLIFTCLG